MTDVQAFADRLARIGIEINFCKGGNPNRLWFWPEAKYNALPDVDKDFIRANRAELKEMVRAGLAPRLDDIRAAQLVCPSCYRSPCIGADHPAFAVLHPEHPITVARRALAEAKQIHDRLVHRAMGAPV